MCLVIQDLWRSDLHEHPPCESQRTVVSSERLLCGRFWRGCLRRGQLCMHPARQAMPPEPCREGTSLFAALSHVVPAAPLQIVTAGPCGSWPGSSST